jgi:GT2 family glycosyltransferase
VDNDSSDGSADMVAERFSWVELVRSEANVGFGPAVNLVAERTHSEWIAPANADIELGSGALAALVGAGGADSRAGALAPRLVLPDGGTQHSVHAFPSLRLALAFNLGLTAIVPGLGDRLCIEGRWDSERPRYVDWAHGAFVLARRRAYEEVGGFDPAQWMYAEDLDLAWRLRRAGWRFRYEPAADVGHELSAATRKAFAEERTARHMAAARAWMVRRRGVAVARAYAAINALGCLGRLAWLKPLARLFPDRFAPRAELVSGYLRLHADAARRKPVGVSARGGPGPR